MPLKELPKGEQLSPLVSIGMSSRERGEKHDEDGHIVYKIVRGEKHMIYESSMGYEERKRELPLSIFIDGEEKGLVDWELAELGQRAIIDDIDELDELDRRQLDELSFSIIVGVLLAYKKSLKTLQYRGKEVDLSLYKSLDEIEDEKKPETGKTPGVNEA